MRGIADAQQAWAIPSAQTIDRDGQELDILPVLELPDAVANERRKPRNFRAEARNPAPAEFVIATLPDDEGALPIVAAVEHYENMAGIEPAEHLRLVVLSLGKTQPQHVDGSAQIDALETGALADDGVAAGGRDHEVAAQLSLGRVRPELHTGDRFA